MTTALARLNGARAEMLDAVERRRAEENNSTVRQAMAALEAAVVRAELQDLEGRVSALERASASPGNREEE